MPKKARRDPPAKRGRSKRPRQKNHGENHGAAQDELRPQAHGGALRNGGTNKGGPGRPTSEIREIARLSYEKRIPILESFADGEPTEQLEVPLFYLLQYAHCPCCEGKLQPNNPTLNIRMVIKGSAKAKDRIDAIEALRQVGIGNKVEVETPNTPVIFGFLTSPEEAARLSQPAA